MSRIRWYHVCFLLALFDVAVILLSLQVHSGTMRDAERLIEKARRHGAQSRWLQRAEERVVRLNAPGNELFANEDYDRCAGRYAFEKEKMLDILAEGRVIEGLGPLPESEINEMISAADELFAAYRPLTELPVDDPARSQAAMAAGESMARMDAAQHEALRKLGLIQSVSDALRDELLQTHQRDLERRARHERYLIAAVIVILVGILAFGRKLYQAERTLQEERRRLQEARRERLAAIGELCSSVAHGIRNPLAGIRSSAQLTLELGKLDAPSRDRLMDILEEGRRLGDRVTGLLALARATADRFADISLNQIVRSATDGLRSELSDRGVSLELDLPDSDVVVRGDQHQLEQIVIELVSNAMDHSSSGGRIQVECDRPGANGRVKIAVQDEGPGVSDDLKNSLFDLFMTTKASGTGIGLATVRRYARLHGGDVALAPSERGARFVVNLPVAMRDSGQESASADADENGV